MSDSVIRNKIKALGNEYITMLSNGYSILMQLSIDNIASFMIIQKIEEQLQCLSYEEATFFGRISDKEFCEIMKKTSGKQLRK